MTSSKRKVGSKKSVDTGMPESERRPRRPVSDQEKTEIALARFQANPSGRWPTPLDVLSKKWPERDPAVISKAIAAAFQQGLVEIRPTAVSLVERNGELEDKLRSRFKLDVAIVVRSPDDPPWERLEKDKKGWEVRELNRMRFGDEVHARLGIAMAAVMAKEGVIRAGEVIGLGSGRGVFHVVDSLANFGQLHIPDVKLVSLTGNVDPKAHVRTLNAILDADQHVDRLASCFNPEVAVGLFPTSTSIVRSESDPRSIPDDPVPTMGLIGIGVLAPGHRFYTEATSKEAVRGTVLGPIAGSLKRLVEAINELEPADPDYCPVADIVNRLFWVGSSGKEAPKAIRTIMDRINSRLLTVDDDQLRKIGRLVVVAGTPAKALAIYHILQYRKDLMVRVLCTDESAAKRIVEF